MDYCYLVNSYNYTIVLTKKNVKVTTPGPCKLPVCRKGLFEARQKILAQLFIVSCYVISQLKSVVSTVIGDSPLAFIAKLRKLFYPYNGGKVYTDSLTVVVTMPPLSMHVAALHLQKGMQRSLFHVSCILCESHYIGRCRVISAIITQVHCLALKFTCCYRET